jgi:tripartite-type tricarboxylate transporter receptor subunit TctC
MLRRHFLHATLGTLAASGAAFAQTWPDHPLRLIVPYPPGGANDITARIYAQSLGAALGQSVIVENKAGAGGEIGADAAAKAQGDGYTLLFAAIGSLTIHSVLAPGQSAYNLKTDLLPVSMGASVPLALAVRSGLPVSNLKELIAYARSQKQPLTYGSAGVGSTEHMAGEYFRQAANLQLVHVPYKGSGPCMQDLLGGRIDMVMETLPALSAYYTSPKMKILAVASAGRSEQLPNVPTMSEAGLPGFEVTTYYGLLAPKGTPRELVDRLSTTMQSLAAKADVQEAMKRAGANALATSPERMNQLVKGEIEKWGRVQNVAHISL